MSVCRCVPGSVTRLGVGVGLACLSVRGCVQTHLDRAHEHLCLRGAFFHIWDSKINTPSPRCRRSGPACPGTEHGDPAASPEEPMESAGRSSFKGKPQGEENYRGIVPESWLVAIVLYKRSWVPVGPR